MTGETRVIRVDLESKRGAETTRRLLEKLNGLRTPKKRFRGLSHEEKREPRHSSEGGLRKRGDSPDTRGTSCAVIANTDEGEATNQRAPSVFSRRSLRLRPAGDDTSPRLRKPSVCMEGATTTGAGIVPPVARNGSISNLLNEEDCTMDAHLEDGQSSPSPRCLSRNLGSYTPVESGSPESKTEGVVAVSRSTVCCGKSSPLLHGRPSFTLGKTVHPVLTKNDTQVEYEEGRETSGARPSLRVCLGAGVPDGPNSGYTAAEKDPLWETAAALQERKKQECEGGTRDVTAGALLREDHQVSSLLRKEDTKSSERGQAGEEESVEQPRQHTDVEHPTVEKHPDGAGPQLEQQSYEEEVELEEDEEEELVLREVAQSFKRSLRQLLVPLHEPKSSSPRTASCESPQSTSLFPSSPSSGGSSSSSVLRRPLSGLRDDVDDCDEEEPLLSSGRQPHRLQSLLERSSFPLLFAFICQAQQLHAQGLLRVLRATQSRRLSSAVAPVTPRALRPGERRLLRLKRELEEQQLRLKSEDTERDIEREGRHRENRFDRERLLRPFLSFHVYPLFAEQLEDVLLEIVKKFTLVDVQLFLAACCTQARLCTLRRRLCSSDVSTARHGLKQAHHSPATSGRVDSGTSTSESLPCSNTSSALQQPLNPHFLPRVKHARSSCPPVASSPLPSSSQSSSSCLSPLGCRGTVPSLASPANPGVWLLDTLLSASVLGSLSSVTRRRLYELNRERARHRKSLELTLQAVLSASGRRAGEHYRTYREGSSTPGKADEAQRSPEKEPMSTPPNTVPAEEETRWARPWHGTERDREGVADSVPKRVESHGTCLGSSFVPAALSSNDADSDPVGRSSLSSRWIQPSYSPFGMEVPDYLFHQQQLRVDQQWRQEWRRDLKTVERLFVLFSSLSGLLGDASASSCLLPTRNGNSGIPSPARLRTDLDETAGADEAAGAHALPVPLHSSSPSVWRSPLCGAEEELIPGENRDPGRPHRSEGRSGRSGVRHAWAPSRMGPGLASTAVPDFSKLLRTFLRVLLGLLQTPLSITHTGESLASPGPIAPAAFEWCGESPRCASATACGAKADACAVRSDPIAARRPRSLVFSSCLAHPSSLARLVLACTSPVVLSRTEGGASSTESQQGENGCPRNSSLDVLIADVYRALQVQLAEQPAKLSTGDLVDLMERLEVLVDAPRPTSSAVAPKIASEVVCMEGLSTHPECPLRPSPPPRPLLTCSQSSVSSTSDLPSDNAGAAGSSSPENSSLLSGWAVPHRSPLLSSATGTAQWCSPSGAGEGCTQSVDAWPKESNRCKKAGNEGNTMRTREFSRELEAMLDFLFFEVLPSRVDTLPVHLNQRCVRIAKTLQTKLCSQRTAPSDPAEERVATTWVARAEILERLLSKFLRSAGQNSPRRAVASSDQPPGTHGSVPFQADIDPEQFGRRKAGEDSRRALADESQDGRGMPEGGRRVSQDPYLVEQRGNEMGREEKENWEEKTISQGGRGRCLPEKMRSGCEETSTEGVEKEVAGRVGPVSKKKQKAGRLPFDHLLPFSVAAGSSSMELGGSKAGPLVHWSERLLGSPVTYLSLITGSDVFSQPLERRQARGTVRAADVLLRCRRYKKRVQRPLDILCGLSKLLNKLGQQRQEKREMVRRLMALTRDDYLPAFSSQAKGTAALMPDGRLLAPRDFPPGWKEDARFPLTDYEREQSFFSCLQVPGLGERAQPPPPPLSLPQRDLLLHLQWKQLMQRNLLVKYPLVTGRQISISDEKGRNDCPPDISSASTLLQRTEEERGRAQPERRKEWHGTTPPRSAEEKSARTGRLIEARRGEYGGVEGQSRVSRARDPRALRHYQGMNFEALVRETPYVGPPNVVQELQRLIFLPPERWKSNMASLSTLRLLQVLKVCAYQYDGLVSFLAKHRKQLVLPMVAQEEMSCGDRRELHPALVNASKARERHPLETTLVSTAGKSDVLLSCYPTGPSGGADGVYRAVLAQATSPWGRLEAFLTCLLDILLSQLQRKYSSEGNGLFPRIASSLVEETGEQGGGLRGPGSRRRGLPQSVQGEDGLEPKALHSARDSRHLRALKLRTSREVSLGASILRALAVLQQHYQRFGRGWMPKKEEENDRSDQEAPEREQAETAREEIARVLGNQGSLDEARGTEHGTRTDKRDKQEDPGRRLEMEKLQMKEKENPVGRSEGTKVMFEAAVHHCAEQVLELLLQTHRLWKLSLLQFVRVVYATEVLFLPRKDSAASLSYSSSSEMHSLSLTNSSAWSSPPGTSMASSERGGKAETTKEEVLKPIRPQVDSAHAQPLHFSLSVQRHLSALAMATQTLLRPPSASGVKGDPTGCSWIPGFPAVSLRERALSSEHRRGTGRSEATRLPTTLDGRSCPEVVGNRRTLEKRADEREAGTMRERKRARRTESSDASSQYSRVAPLPAASIAPLTRSFAAVYRHVYLSVRRQRAQGDSTEETKPRRSHQRADQQRSGGVSQTAPSASDRSLGTAAPTEQLELSGSRLNLTNTEEEKIDIHTNSLDDEEALLEEYEKVLLRLAAEAVCLCGSLAEKHWRATGERAPKTLLPGKGVTDGTQYFSYIPSAGPGPVDGCVSLAHVFRLYAVTPKNDLGMFPGVSTGAGVIISAAISCPYM